MCLILFAYKMDETFPLIVAANRDEFYARPTAGAHFWEDFPNMLAGRDLEKLGTWIGVTKQGRFSALTNYRNPHEDINGKRSRGELVANALQYNGNIEEFMKNLSNINSYYPGYNLLAGDINNLYYYSNVGQNLQKLEPGIYGLSNHLLNTSWPKVKKGKECLMKLLQEKKQSYVEGLFELLKYAEPFPDELLPQTGVSIEMERMLSPLFIQSKNYGTRSSTVILISTDEIQYFERTFQDTIEERKFIINFI